MRRPIFAVTNFDEEELSEFRRDRSDYKNRFVDKVELVRDPA